MLPHQGWGTLCGQHFLRLTSPPIPFVVPGASADKASHYSGYQERNVPEPRMLLTKLKKVVFLKGGLPLKRASRNFRVTKLSIRYLSVCMSITYLSTS